MELKTISSLTLDGQLYFNNDMEVIEGVINPLQYKTSHAPALVELENGDMLCAWFAGSFEGNSDISIIMCRLKKDSSTWEAPVKISNDNKRSEQNPSFFKPRDGELWLIYTSQLERMEGKDNMQFTSIIKYQKSFDNGITWSDPEVLFDKEGSFCRQPIQILSNGRWIFGNWMCTDSNTGLLSDPTVLQISDDKGNTWKAVNMPDSSGRVHANIIEVDNGKLIALMRSRYADNIYISRSDNFGDTWSVPEPTLLPNNNSSISALKLQSGCIAIAYNPTASLMAEKGKISWPGLRCPVAVALSEDEGKTFPIIRYMERGEGFYGEENRINNKQYEYPYLMQSKDGNLHLAFAYKNRVSIKYMRFTEEDIIGKKRKKEDVYNPTSANI